MATADARLRWFSLAWGVVAVTEVDHLRAPAAVLSLDTLHWLVPLAGVACLARPGRFPPLLLLAGVRTLSLLARAPHLENHEYLHLLTDLGLLTAFGRVEHVARLARALLVLTYGAAGFAKLNADFFDPSVSCVGWAWERAALALPFLPVLGDDAVVALAVLTTAAELILPILLLVGRTRWLGLVGVLLMHTVFGLRHPTFAWTCAALALWFVPPAAAERVRPFARAAERAVGGAAIVVGALLFALHGDLQRGGDYARVLSLGVPLLWLAGVPLLARLRGPARPDGPLPLRPRGAGWLWVALMLLSVGSPYLGLKTRTAMSMFSNLRTAARGNHLLLADAPQPFGLQRDLVRIVEADELPWFDYALRDVHVPLLELRRRMVELRARGGTVAMTVEYRGRRHHSPAMERDPFFGAAPPLWARKLLIFRPVDTVGPALCAW
ncbi:MAG: hypothetical protein H6704_13570 [Myxococcales bacterium]|nr:hypothetical protein [Myxococcales bacterium]